MCHYSKVDDFGESSAPKGNNRSELAQLCLESIAKNTDYPAELVVMDNGGNPDDTEYFVGKTREGVINTLIRYKENMHFAYAWNQGAKLATGKYLCFICNDIEVYPKWLSSCVALLEKYPDERLIATPFITYDKRRFTATLEDGSRLNPRSGSNCMIMTRETFSNIGEFRHHRIAGTLWFNMLRTKGYKTIAPSEDLAADRGWRNGVNFSIPITVKQTLLTGTEADFTDKAQ